jgi:hypothetical protein
MLEIVNEDHKIPINIIDQVNALVIPSISGTTAIGSPIITAMIPAEVANITIGMEIVNGAVFPAGTTVLSIDSTTQVTVSNNAIAAGASTFALDVPANPTTFIDLNDNDNLVRTQFAFNSNFDQDILVTLDTNTTKELIKSFTIKTNTTGVFDFRYNGKIKISHKGTAPSGNLQLTFM